MKEIVLWSITIKWSEMTSYKKGLLRDNLPRLHDKLIRGTRIGLRTRKRRACLGLLQWTPTRGKKRTIKLWKSQKNIAARQLVANLGKARNRRRTSKCYWNTWVISCHDRSPLSNVCDPCINLPLIPRISSCSYLPRVLRQNNSIIP